MVIVNISTSHYVPTGDIRFMGNARQAWCAEVKRQDSNKIYNFPDYQTGNRNKTTIVNPFKSNAVKWLHFKAFTAILI